MSDTESSYCPSPSGSISSDDDDVKDRAAIDVDIQEEEKPVDERSGQLFEFFQLPRELRDMIYSYTLKPTQRLNKYRGLSINISRCIDTKLLRVSRIFAAEYVDKAKAETVVTIKDQNDLDTNCGPVQLPRALRYVAKFDIRLWLNSYLERDPKTKASEINKHKKWIQKMLSGVPAKNFGIDLTVYVMHYVYGSGREDRVIAHISRLASLRSVKSINVYNTQHMARPFRALERKKLTMAYGTESREFEQFAEAEWEDVDR